MTELNLIQHIVSRLEPQVQDYVEVRNLSTRAQLIQVLSKFEERRNGYTGTYRNGPQRNQGFESRNWFDRDNPRFNNNTERYLSRNSGPSEYFSRGDRRHGGRLNDLKVLVYQDDQS
ncbi:hypothetical protein TNCV_321071 [Trichonephila clavipes]|nr:hypothetical protein TNCV_321071 [Trichonephila clavipes]